MPLELQKIPLKDKISAILMQRIVDGEIEAKEKLKEAHLAKEFGVSQAPVREAIVSLVAKGILEHIPNVGTHVKSYSSKERIEIYETREALELYACRFIRSGVDILLIKEIFEKMQAAAKADDVKSLVEYDQFFHELLLKGCDNRTILRTWREQYAKSAVAHVIEEFNTTLENIVSLHFPIMEAIEELSIEKCTKAIEYHYKTIIKNISNPIKNNLNGAKK